MCFLHQHTCKYRIRDSNQNVQQLKDDREPLFREGNNERKGKLAPLARRTWLWLLDERGDTSVEGKISQRLSHGNNNDLKQALKMKPRERVRAYY